MAKTLYMNFNLDNGKSKALTLAAPKDDVTADQVSNVMSTMINKNALTVDGAALESSKSAYIREVTDTVLF